VAQTLQRRGGREIVGFTAARQRLRAVHGIDGGGGGEDAASQSKMRWLTETQHRQTRGLAPAKQRTLVYSLHRSTRVHARKRT
jgi:hypothetical protein